MTLTCRICLDVLLSDTFEGTCGHSFHKACIQDWIDMKFVGDTEAATCPLCVKQTLSSFARLPGSVSIDELRRHHEQEMENQRRVQIYEDQRMAARVLTEEIIADMETTYANRGLFEAVRNNDPEATVFYLDAGADINVRRMQNAQPILIHGQLVLRIEQSVPALTPLMIASCYDSVDAALVLLARGADVNARDARGNDAATIALTSGSLRMLRLLESHARAVAGTPGSVENPLVVEDAQNESDSDGYESQE